MYVYRYIIYTVFMNQKGKQTFWGIRLFYHNIDAGSTSLLRCRSQELFVETCDVGKFGAQEFPTKQLIPYILPKDQQPSIHKPIK